MVVYICSDVDDNNQTICVIEIKNCKQLAIISLSQSYNIWFKVTSFEKVFLFFPFVQYKAKITFFKSYIRYYIETPYHHSFLTQFLRNLSFTYFDFVILPINSLQKQISELIKQHCKVIDYVSNKMLTSCSTMNEQLLITSKIKNLAEQKSN